MNCSFKSRFLVAAAALGIAVLPLALPSSAHAWWRGGVYVGVAPPVVAGPWDPYYSPDYVPPPVYSPPVEAYSAPPEAYAPPPMAYQETPDPYPSAPPVYQPPVYHERPSEYGSQAGVPTGLYCYAGPHICPLASLIPAGSNCSCPGDGGRWVAGQAG